MNLRLAAVRRYLSRERPYLSAAIWALVPVASDKVGTMAVDRYWRLYYNEEFLEHPVDQLAGVLYHEVLHLLRDHPDRMEDSPDHTLANLATDMEINDDLGPEWGPGFPIRPVYPADFGLPNGLLAEEYLRCLLDRTQAGAGAAGTTPQGVTQAPCVGPAPADTTSSQWQNEQDPGGRAEAGGAQPGAGRCGSCATGKPAPWEEPAPGKSDVPGLSPVEGKLVRRAVATEIGKAQGSVPGHLRRWAEEQTGPPRVDWRRELAAHLRRATQAVAGNVDYTYRRPSRRRAGPVVLPGLVGRRVRAAVVVDTSGSIEQQQLNQAMAEVAGLLKAAWASEEPVPVLAVDAHLQACGKVWKPEQVIRLLRGGGGTDMGVGIREALRFRPELIVVITDGLTPWPEEPPPVPVLVVLLGGNGDGPAWARTVRIS